MNNYIVIPTYNERTNIELLIPKLFAIMPSAKVLVVDDDSPDGTQQAVNELMKAYPNLELYPHNQKAGFAKAYVDGFRLLLQRAEEIGTITMMDADLSHDPAYLPQFYAQLDAHDLVIGSRYVPGGGVSGWEWWRKALSYFGNVYLRGIARLPIRDITGGYNCMKADFLRRVPFTEPTARGYAFQFVLKSHLVNLGARCTEVPILFRNRMEGESKLTHHIVSEAILIPWKMKMWLKK